MPTASTAEVIHGYNEAFRRRDAAAIAELLADDCVLEDVQPAPDGTRYVGRDAVAAFWGALATDPDLRFEPEDVEIADERAIVRWRAFFATGDAGSVRGVNLMRVRDGRIVEALGYVKTP